MSLTHAQSGMATVDGIGRGSDRAPVNGSPLPVPKRTGKLTYCKLTYVQIYLHEDWPIYEIIYNLIGV